MSAAEQLAFDAPAFRARRRYHFGLPDRSGPSTYTVLIRGPHDPERRSREARAGEMGKAGAAVSWKKPLKLSAEEWRMRIVALLEDGEPRTFNAIMVDLADVTADVVFGDSPEQGLWLAVERLELGWTAEAPIYFLHRKHITAEAA